MNQRLSFLHIGVIKQIKFRRGGDTANGNGKSALGVIYSLNKKVTANAKFKQCGI